MIATITTATARRLPTLAESRTLKSAAAAGALLALVLLMVAGHLLGAGLVHDLHVVPQPVRHLLLGSTVDHVLSRASVR